ncbi:MAG: hypothetical protein KatS3mg129_1938 [Leptospiraceae bacterium]|nr:MAG: hypothetical protein KatS3mg129_1938 [Leptospiraceae bacterium]
MKVIQKHLLFISRTTLYLLAVILPIFHPAIAVPHDIYTKISLIFLLPISMFLAYYYKPPKSFIKGFLILIITLFLICLIFFPFNRAILFPIFISLWGFFSTLLIFNTKGRFPFLGTIEIFILGFIYYKILQYSRSSEDIAKISEGITNFYIVITIISFLFHSLILYITIYSDKTLKEFKKEILIFSFIGIPFFILFTFILPPDFIKHQTVFNELEPEPPLNPLDGEGFFKRRNGQGEQERNFRNGKPLGKRQEKYPSELQNKGQNQDNNSQPQELPQNQDQDQNSSGNSSKNRLEGVPSDQWEQFKNSQQAKKGKQLAVMIIASNIQPVYAAESYLTNYNPEKGFELDKEELLNQLKDQHLISTWKDPFPQTDEKRSPYSIFYLSTIKDRVLAYRPFQVEPTIMDQRYHPFDLSYTAISGISISTPEEWKSLSILDLKEENNINIKKYTQLQLNEKDKKFLENYLESILKNKDKSNYFIVLDSILQFYKTYQYKLGFNEYTDIETIKNFLEKTKEGDCTEFSATTILLLRMAGIPSRLVHGWIASRELQTPAHVGGIIHLRKKIPYLQKFDLNDLYLVTTSHRHAWIQVYFPRYGWIDIETTSYAIPPKPEFDPNAKDVVIPLIEEEPYPPKPKKFVFPYKIFFMFLGIVGGITLLLLYIYRICLNLFYYIFSRKYSPRALNYLNQLFYMRLYEYGYPKRKYYETPLEYAEKLPETFEFAQKLIELKFRINLPESEKINLYKELLNIYKKTLNNVKPKGIKHLLKRIFTLKGIFYKI